MDFFSLVLWQWFGGLAVGDAMSGSKLGPVLWRCFSFPSREEKPLEMTMETASTMHSSREECVHTNVQ